MGKRPVVWFYILACAIAWLGWVPAALAAVIVTRATDGSTAGSALFGALVRWCIGPACYVVALFGPLVLLFAGRIATGALGLTDVPPAPQGDPATLAVAALITSLLANPWDEVGWRGFALPHLQKRHTALAATLIIGTLWGLWHLPFSSGRATRCWRIFFTLVHRYGCGRLHLQRHESIAQGAGARGVIGAPLAVRAYS